jgi:aryl-alcohol dehydrogenase-like predicted oxidoreductase
VIVGVQLEISRKNLGLETIDIYYVHNPETQLTEVLLDVFKKRICDAFGALEEACAEGKISAYGVATWNGFRVPYNKRGHLSLEDLVHAAEDAGINFCVPYLFKR